MLSHTPGREAADARGANTSVAEDAAEPVAVAEVVETTPPPPAVEAPPSASAAAPDAATAADLPPHTMGAPAADVEVPGDVPSGDVPSGDVPSGDVPPVSSEIAPSGDALTGDASVEVPGDLPEAIPPVAEASAPAPAPEPQSEITAESSAETTSSSALTDAPADATAELSGEAPVTEATTPDAPDSLFTRGELIAATITETSPTTVRVDLAGKGEGVVPTHELEKMGKRTLESLQVGATVNVLIINPRDHQGKTIVSINRAMEEVDWQTAEQYRQSQEVHETKIAGYNKGGLIVRFGRLRGFVPQSQMSPERRRMSDGENAEERWSKMVNETILIKVMEVDRTRNRLILSERSANRESREQRKANLIGQLTVGEQRTGRVVSLEDFGAFIDIGGAEGLVHLTELSYQHVNHPRDLLKVGQEVRVRVISVDPVAKRIGLSLKQLEADPWDRVATGYNNGQLVRGTVTKLTKFGAFAQIDDLPEIEGLIHISELSDRRVTHPREVVNEGDVLTLRIVKMDVENRRLGLSLKKVNSPEYLDADWGAGDEG